MNYRPHVFWCLFVLLAVLGPTACKDDRTSPLRKGTAKSEFAIPQTPAPTDSNSAPPPQPDEDPEEARLEALAKREIDFTSLQPYLRRFERKRRAYELSEEKYLERVYFWALSFTTLEWRGTPGVFAGDLPEHDEMSYSYYTESADDLLKYLFTYLVHYEKMQDDQIKMLLRVKQDAEYAVDLPFPGSGSRAQDAIDAMKTPAFAKVVDESNSRIPELTMISGKHLGHSAHQLLDKVTNLLQGFLNGQ